MVRAEPFHFATLLVQLLSNIDAIIILFWSGSVLRSDANRQTRGQAYSLAANWQRAVNPH